MLSYRSDITAISYLRYIISVLIFIPLLLVAHVCFPFEMLIGTGDTGSFSYFAGKSICSSIKKNEADVTCRLVPIEESADKLTNLQNDFIDLALISSKTIYDALHGTGLFQYITIEYDDLRLVMPLYRSPISLIARRDAHILKLDDLPGKRVNGGVFNTLPNQVFKKIISLKGWQKDDFPLYQNLPHAFSQDFLALKSGSVQAMFHVGMHPDKSLKQLLTQSQSTLVGLDDADIRQLVENREGFSSCQIEAGTYPAISSNIKTLALETFLVASAATDDDTVQLVLTALNDSKDQLQYAHPSFLRQSIDVNTLNDSYLTPHPSAIRFFAGARQPVSQ